MRGVLVLFLLSAACSRPSGPVAATTPDPCAGAAPRLAEIARLRADGYLGRALRQADSADAVCPTAATQLARAEILADLGLDELATQAYTRYAAAEPAGAEAARAAVAALAKRPPFTRTASADEARQAALLYRDGVDLRLRGDHPTALRQLRRAYALAPHPLTIVQIGRTHEAAGDAIEARRAFDRAL
ncbi:MAG TPA: hypothetical protein VML75_01590, partial [Kofleriaceae bacterium]|nr:hypothetical protein [Kofleriaceae bacterium]